MAEEGAPVISNQRLVAAVAVVLIGVSIFFLWTFRGCIPVIPGAKDSGYSNIYTNLELKDAANVIARLKELKIPYKVLNNGATLSVPKDKSDEAKLGLAEKNLPQGGAVGWEIFNETRMGATDFDRRIQLIRAISGELSRTIKRIEGVDDARVQIVLPETRLFEVSKAPVTAAVLLKIAPGKRLRPEQVNGIIHLVASSVENLKTENVTIVDDSGNILSGRAMREEAAPPPPPVAPPPQKEAAPKALQPEKPAQEKPKALAEEEKALLKLKAKEEYERQLTAKVQELLNQFYPQNKVIVRVSILFGKPKAGTRSTKLKIHADSGNILAPVKKITTIVLIDNKLNLTNKLRRSTYQTVALAIPYDKKRGDRIILKQVPFHYAEVTPEKLRQKFPAFMIPKIGSYMVWAGAGLLAFAIFFIIIRRAFRPRQGPAPFERGEERGVHGPTETEATATVKQIKDIAKENPERLANLIKKWLTEGGA